MMTRPRTDRLDRRGSPRRARSGQAMVESVFMIIVLAFIFFTAMQISQLFAAKEINYHAAAAGARAKTVGFNDFMVHKVVRVATIPNAGNMVTPAIPPRPGNSAYYRHTPVHLQWGAALRNNPISPQHTIEASRIPLYLGAERWGELDAILDYEDYDTIGHSEIDAGDTIAVRARQRYPLRMPMHDWFYANDNFPLRGEAWHADHASLYLE